MPLEDDLVLYLILVLETSAGKTTKKPPAGFGESRSKVKWFLNPVGFGGFLAFFSFTLPFKPPFHSVPQVFPPETPIFCSTLPLYFGYKPHISDLPKTHFHPTLQVSLSLGQ